MTTREFDVVLFGATGYTGKHVARELQSLSRPQMGERATKLEWAELRWAIAGRSHARLTALCTEWGLTPSGIIVADVSEATTLREMSARGRIVMNATGPVRRSAAFKRALTRTLLPSNAHSLATGLPAPPLASQYRFLGEPVVEACIHTQTDYVDLCGEPEFIDRCLLRHMDAARSAGVLVVHACAFDSIPADIGTLYTALQFAPPALCAHADMYHTLDASGPTEGALAHTTTYQAAVHGFGDVGATRAQRHALMEKMEADAPGSSAGPPQLGPKLRVKTGPAFHPELGKLTLLRKLLLNRTNKCYPLIRTPTCSQPQGSIRFAFLARTRPSCARRSVSSCARLRRPLRIPT